LIFCHLVKCVSSAMHNVNGQHIGESDYWFSVTARLPWSFKSTLLANQNSTCHENIRYIHLQQAWTYTSLKSRLQIIQAFWFKCGVVAVAMSFTDLDPTWWYIERSLSANIEYYWNLEFLHIVIIIKAVVLFPQTYMTLENFGYYV
jgi:hypothetical protein